MNSLSNLSLGKIKEFNDLQNTRETFDSLIDFNQQLINIVKGISIDELDLMNINDFNDILKDLNFDMNESEVDFINEVTINDKVYGTISKDEIKFLTKEIKLIELWTNKKEYDYLTLVSSIIFREKLDYGIQNDFTDESIIKRYELFIDHITFSQLYPYIIKINNINDNK